jgi:hypothetical protein
MLYLIFFFSLIYNNRLFLLLLSILIYICTIHMGMRDNERSSRRPRRMRREGIHLKRRIVVERGRGVKAIGIMI